MAGFTRPKPLVINAEMLTALVAEAGEQRIGGSYQKSSDPAFPYWGHEPAKQYLVYVPKLTTLDADGETVMDIDKPLVHSINFNGSYSKIRCTNGLALKGPDGEFFKDEQGRPLFDGTCPICENISSGFDLAKLMVEAEASTLNLNPEDKENEQVKGIRRKYFGGRALTSPDKKLTIPLAVFETIEDEKGRPQIVDENGVPLYKIFWYTISERQYEKTWQSALDNSENGVDLLAGNVFSVQFGKKDANGAPPNARDAVKDLTVVIRENMTGNLRSAGVLDPIDEATKAQGWSKSKAAEVLSDNMFTSVPEITTSLATITEDIAAKIAMMNTPKGGGGSTSLATLTGGNAKAADVAPAGALPAGATDASEEPKGGLLG